MIFLTVPDETSDSRLLRDARQGDRGAQRLIYERYFPLLYGFIRLRVDDVEQARDLTADVFLAFFAALQGDSPPRARLRAWLFRVARNKLYDHYNRSSRLSESALDDLTPHAAEAVAPDVSPEASLLHGAQVDSVRRALRQLKAEQQEVLVLRFLHGLSLEETADLMARSVPAVKSLQFRAVDRLRALIDIEEEA